MLGSSILFALWAFVPSDSVLGIGDSAANLTFKDIHYLPRQIREFGEPSATVLVFITRECPLAKRYLPKVVALEQEFRAQGVQFAFVNVGADESIVSAATQMVENAVPFPLLKDFDLESSRALGITRTPEAVVLDREYRLRYRGRVDDQYRLSGVRPTPSREDLKEAIVEVVNGRNVSVSETPSEGCALTAPRPTEGSSAITFSEHVAPIVFAKCANCHVERGEAPFPLVRYEQYASRSDMIDEVVREERMPPWYGAAEYGDFQNHRVLTQAERALIRAWIAGGTAPGDEQSLPAAPKPRESKFRIGDPDLVLTQLGRQDIPATGIVPYQYVVMPHLFLKDTYLEAIEISGDNPPVLHHANLAFFEIGERYRAENFITGYVPGGDPMQLDPGMAVKIPAGSVLGLQVHYVTTGEQQASRISVALRFPKTTVRKLLHHHQITNTRFVIPPGAQGHLVNAKKTFEPSITGVGMFAHMHLRGRDMMFRAISPDRDPETLLIVPNYNFDWQQSYHWKPGAKRFPPGTRIEVTAHFDNSRFNPFNPDPASPVRFGLQTEEEMMYGFFFYTIDDEALDLSVDPKTGQLRSGS